MAVQNLFSKVYHPLIMESIRWQEAIGFGLFSRRRLKKNLRKTQEIGLMQEAEVSDLEKFMMSYMDDKDQIKNWREFVDESTLHYFIREEGFRIILPEVQSAQDFERKYSKLIGSIPSEEKILKRIKIEGEYYEDDKFYNLEISKGPDFHRLINVPCERDKMANLQVKLHLISTLNSIKEHGQFYFYDDLEKFILLEKDQHEFIKENFGIELREP